MELLVLLKLLFVLFMMLEMLSLGASTLRSAYLSVPVMLWGLLWVQLLRTGLGEAIGARSITIMLSRGCEAS